MIRAVVFALFTFLALLAPVTSAHEVRPALLSLTEQTGNEYTAVFKQPQVQGRFLNLQVETNCDTELIESRTSAAALQEKFRLSCPDRLEQITIIGLERTLIDAMITITRLDGSQQNHLVNGRNPSVSTARGAATPVYLTLGMEHLFFGLDHVLFVLLLLYLVKGWQNLVKVVTSFTVAHSITLALSALNIVTVSQAPVEALIALSILLLAAEALGPSDSLVHRQPWLITFIFGLLHGLGFAGALAEIGLPEGSTVMALFLFNVGIEIGQLVIIAIALLLLTVIRRLTIAVPQAVTHAPVYLVGGLSAYWFMQRSIHVIF